MWMDGRIQVDKCCHSESMGSISHGSCSLAPYSLHDEVSSWTLVNGIIALDFNLSSSTFMLTHLTIHLQPNFLIYLNIVTHWISRLKPDGLLEVGSGISAGLAWLILG